MQAVVVFVVVFSPSCCACNWSFLSCLKLHYENEAKCKVFIIKNNFLSNANETDFHMKSIALSLAFTIRFIATRKWPHGLNARPG